MRRFLKNVANEPKPTEEHTQLRRDYQLAAPEKKAEIYAILEERMLSELDGLCKADVKNWANSKLAFQ